MGNNPNIRRTVDGGDRILRYHEEDYITPINNVFVMGALGVIAISAISAAGCYLYTTSVNNHYSKCDKCKEYDKCTKCN